MSTPAWWRPRPALWNHTVRRRAAAVLGLTVAIGLLPQYAPQAEAKGLGKPGTQQDGDPARGTDAKAEKPKKNPVDSAVVTDPAKVTWPKPGRAETAVSTKLAQLKGLPLKAASPTASGPDELAVEVVDHKKALAAGVDGVLLKVARTDGVDAAGQAKVQLDYSGFAGAYGGSYGSRLRFVQYPECLLTTPQKKECSTPRELKSANSVAAQTLTTTVDAAPDRTGVTTQTLKAATTGAAVTLLAATAGSSGDQGNYGATSLQASSEWSVSNSSGAFNWSYPMRTPPVPGGLAPSVSLGYTSQSVDGQTAATNSQGSWAGEGFGYEPGYIERRYKPCSQDGQAKANGDQCWAFDNATVTLAGGTSGEIVKDDATGQWQLSNDDNSKIEKVTGATNGDNDGEYWRLTTTDGTEYYFGLDRLPGWRADDPATTGTVDPDPTTNSTWTVPVYGDDTGEPCHASTFDASYCTQAWRWNLSYVKAPRGNVMSFYYGKETNYYSQNLKYTENGKPYVRGGYLARADYGQRDGQVYTTAAPARVVFATDERCLDAAADCEPGDLTAATATRWPDVPWDQNCAVNTKCEGQNSPTFWTRKKLSSVTTQTRSGTGYSDVDHWKLTHVFTDNGDGSKSLWLKNIDHEGRVGTATAMPSIELYGSQLPNRVDVAGDNIQAMNRFRLSGVLNESGGQLSVVYAPADCSAAALPKEGESTKRCYPVKWNPPGVEEPITDWFHKYVVSMVTQTDLVGGTPDMSTSYDYIGDAGWRKSRADGITEAKYLTWGDWRGYAKVRVTGSEGGVAAADNTRTEHAFFRGLDGDATAAGGTRTETLKDSTGTTYTDADHLSGFELETTTYNGSFSADAIVSKSISTPWTQRTGSRKQDWGTTESWYLRPKDTNSYTALEGYTAQSPKWRVTKSANTYDTVTGRATKVDDLGVDGDDTDNRCTLTYYADNAANNMLAFPYRVHTTATTCSDTANHGKETLSDDLTFYDGQALGTGPTKGDTTKVQRLASLTVDNTPVYETITDLAPADFDAYGRPLKVKDAAGTETSMVYTDTNGLATKKVETNTLGWQTSTDYNPAWGSPTGQTDPNGRRTDFDYDGLGRLTNVWLPDLPKTNSDPSIKYAYTVRKDGPSVVTTQKIQRGATYGVPEYTLYDGNLRPIQVQTEGPNSGRMIADTFYDGLGRVVKTNGDYYTTGAPSGTPFAVVNGDVDSQNLTQYDGAGRKTADIFAVAGDERWRTTYAYGGDRVHTDPPNGQAPTTTITDGRGQTTEIRQYKGSAPLPTGTSADYVSTKYTYNKAGLLGTVKDGSGNLWSYAYDKRGRKTGSDDPDTGHTDFAYDILDRLTSTTDSRGKKTSTVYDKLGRTTATWEGEPTTGKQLSAFNYDVVAKGEAYGTYTYVNGSVYAARLVTQLDTSYQPLTVRYSVSKTAEPELGGTYDYNTAYNTDGTVQSTRMPAAGGLSSEGLFPEYDGLQRQTALHSAYGSTFDNNTIVNLASYSNTSQLKQLELNSNTDGAKKSWLTYGYERGTNRLTSSRVDREGATAVTYDARYTYDQVGNVTSITDKPTGGQTDAQCFQYDYQRRMTEAWTSTTTPDSAIGTGGTNAACSATPSASSVGGPAPYWRSYQFDDVTGNRKKETAHGFGTTATPDVTRTYSYGDADQDGTAGEAGDGGPHALTKVETLTPAYQGNPQVKSQDTYKYDSTGNTTARALSGNTQTLDWNAQGKLAKVTGAKTTDYVYDASGQRLLRNVGGEKTLYLPGMELRLNPTTKAVTGTRYYTFGALTVAMRTASGVQFLSSDSHGTAETAIDAATGETTRRRMDPYGNERGDDGKTWVNDKGFLGKTVDESTGLVNIGAREYEAENGRFISADPIIDFSDPQQINGYSYANNNPVAFVDATGLRLADCVGGWSDCGPGSSFVPSGSTGGTGGLPSSNSSGSTRTVAEEKAEDARTQADAAKQRVKSAARELAKIAMDELGITDGLDCFTTGNLGACGATAFNIATSFAGGLVGKLAGKYALSFKWAKGEALAKRIWGLGRKLTSAAKDWYKSSKLAKKAEKEAEAAVEAGAKCNSFIPKTKVLMADGSQKSIEDIDIGDRVIATDPETGKTEVQTVTAEIKGKGTKHLVKVTIDTDGDKGPKTASVTATDGHPFWVPELREWIDATDLKPGERLRTSTGPLVQITAIQRWTQQSTVHNLTVSDLHTYYVLAGDTPVLVHNIGGKKGGYGDACKLFYPGEHAGGTIPARNQGRSWTQAEIDQTNVNGNTYGCHTCGTNRSGYPSGTWVKDHQPVSTFVDPSVEQQLFPQCMVCSGNQGRAAAQMKRDKINPYTDF
ncbi:RHS repeat-associated core domain-containing protein [Streptomyces sp. yr375]|uniref:polymorphic toxin-type HINT domain-containing protein n=1 Tax=Streptomyces sp. yr375 TaxID=1761906 RepID=UPI0008C0E0F1|nr:polymorphic toxin-type HINT domain-containing protein [Streptomyces sp. yr375]SER77570.1 RHS repeat-associated core domain-containing protein [Streptomyces sp. yr375]